MNRFTPYLIGILIISIGLNIAQAVDRNLSERENSQERIKVILPQDPEYDESLLEHKIKNQRYRFGLLNASPDEYVNKKLVLYGYASVDNYYNYAYLDFNLSYYSVLLFDGEEYIHIYFPKGEKNRKLMEMLARKGVKGMPLKVTAVENKFSLNQIEYLAEGLDWEVLK